MKKIECMTTVTGYTSKEFLERLQEAVNSMQAARMEVNVQYATLHDTMTALVIGRKAETKQ